jgi:uridine kinase
MGDGSDLMHARAPGRTHVTNVCDGAVHTVRAGTLLGTMLPRELDGDLVVAGLVDRRPASLATPLWADATIAPLSTGHWEGARIYRRSVALLLLEAGARIHPELELHVGHSFGYAQAITVNGAAPPWETLARELNAAMVELVDQDLPLVEPWWTAEEAIAYFERNRWSGAATLLRTRRRAAVPVASYGQVFAPRFGPLVARTGALTEFALVAEPDGLLLVHGVIDPTPTSGRRSAAPDAVDTRGATLFARSSKTLLAPNLRWLEALGTTSVGELDRACIDGDVSELIRVAEGFQEKRIGQIADAIAGARDRVQVVCVAGPSASGKTTFIRRLRVQLQVDGLRPIGVSLDDYYADRSAIPRDDHGEYDFEAFDALRRDLLQEHLLALLAGKTVRTARYDFKTGASDPQGGAPLALTPGDVLLVEGIHGLNPALLSALPDERIFRVFCCPMVQLPLDRLTHVHASDLRLLRRIVRDRHGRETDAAATILRWPSVRAGERRHIFPWQDEADEVFDSSLVYEFCVLRVFAERYLLEVPTHHDAFPTADRLLGLLEQFVTIYPDHVPPTSILREFIGGSGFEY